MKKLSAAIIMAALCMAGPALAHTDLVKSIPAADSTGPAPKALVLTFSGKVVPAFTRFDLARGNGLKIALTTIIAAVGIENLIIIDTPDALLVADKNHSQDVKQIVGQLKKIDHEAYKLHRTVHRPWGTYTVLEEGTNFKMKRIVVKPGASLSLQMHYHRSEHWIVVDGMAKVVNGDQDLLIATNESTYIPAGHKHRLENPGKVDLVMIEVQSGSYLGEDDIVRFEDNYGRV